MLLHKRTKYRIRCMSCDREYMLNIECAVCQQSCDRKYVKYRIHCMLCDMKYVKYRIRCMSCDRKYMLNIECAVCHVTGNIC